MNDHRIEMKEEWVIKRKFYVRQGKKERENCNHHYIEPFLCVKHKNSFLYYKTLNRSNVPR